MPRKKAAITRLSQPYLRTQQRSPESDTFVDRFLCTVCDTSRRYILEMLATPDDKDTASLRELRSGEIAEILGLSHATTSEHLRQLADLQLVITRKQGTMVYYRLANNMFNWAFLDLLHVLDNRDQEPLS